MATTTGNALTRLLGLRQVQHEAASGEALMVACLRTKGLHPIDTDIARLRLGVFADVDMPGADVAPGVELAPLRDRKPVQVKIIPGQDVFEEGTEWEQSSAELGSPSLFLDSPRRLLEGVPGSNPSARPIEAMSAGRW